MKLSHDFKMPQTLLQPMSFGDSVIQLLTKQLLLMWVTPSKLSTTCRPFKGTVACDFCTLFFTKLSLLVISEMI